MQVERESAGLPEDAVVVARVGRPHGVRGELRLRPTSDRPERLEALSTVWLSFSETRGVARRMVVTALRLHGRLALARFEGVESREEAARWTNADAWARRAELPAWGPDEFGAEEVLGAELWDGDDRVGEITGLETISGTDYFQVEHAGREVIVPAVLDWLVERDSERRRVVMRLPAGLLEP